jgi:hypothetical protein
MYMQFGGQVFLKPRNKTLFIIVMEQADLQSDPLAVFCISGTVIGEFM